MEIIQIVDKVLKEARISHSLEKRAISNKSIKFYWEAIRKIFGPKRGEKWFDDNGDKLRAEVHSEGEARRNVWKAMKA